MDSEFKITSVEFVKSAVKKYQYPPAKPHIAFVGKSNVGKSSLLNTIVNRKKIAKTSKTPGRTQLINFFVVNEQYYFVDLPGYGFSKVSDRKRKKFDDMTQLYFRDNELIRAVMFLVDMRHEPHRRDIEAYEWLKSIDLNVVPVFTKSDRIPATKKKNLLKKYMSILGCDLYGDEALYFSSKTRENREQLLDRIGYFLNL